MRRSLIETVILQDTREQKPLEFGDTPVEVATLSVGDYGVRCGSKVLPIAFERKSQIDALGTIGGGRARFEREIERSAALVYFGVVVEVTLEKFLMGHPRSAMNPVSAIGSLVAWDLRSNVHVHYCDSRALAAALIRKYLLKASEYYQKGEWPNAKNQSTPTGI